ncbi:MAG: response regulator transcription factor [Planctomycetota bacterium]
MISVMLIEDNDETRDSLAAQFKHEGFSVQKAGNAEQAAFLLQHGRPDVIVCGIHLKGVDGLELTRRLRARDRDEPFYVILTNSEDSPEDRTGAVDVGADDYLVVPVGIDELRARIRLGFRMRKLQIRLLSLSATQSVRDTKVEDIQGALATVHQELETVDTRLGQLQEKIRLAARSVRDEQKTEALNALRRAHEELEEIRAAARR